MRWGDPAWLTSLAVLLAGFLLALIFALWRWPMKTDEWVAVLFVAPALTLLLEVGVRLIR